MTGLLALALVVGVGSITAARPSVPAMQRSDLASMLDGTATLIPEVRANTAKTGSWVNIANYSSVAVAIVSGQADNATTYVVIQDSTPGSAVATIDSVKIAADSTYYDFNYHSTGQFVRAVQRASGSSADTVTSTVLVLAAGARVR